MKTLRVGIIQQKNTADISDNRRRIAEKVRELARQGARLIVNQELHDSLYFCQTEHVALCSLAPPIP
ncbi:MAG: acyltransferase, partial [Muribaculaceae bacterium]|nr:acyltransferase [Muribaculaceae bacterium]